MKELYISPEANIIAFAPTERLANNSWAKSVVDNAAGINPGVISDHNDVPVGGDVDTNIFD